MSNSWWSDKLGGQPATPTYRPAPPVAPAAPVYPPVATPPYTPQYVQPVTPQVLPPSATAERCPNCSSGNYVGTMETKQRCYDCGYPVQQSGSGTPGVRIPGSQGGAVQAAKQISTANNFNPNVIVDRIG